VSGLTIGSFGAPSMARINGTRYASTRN